MTFRVGFKCQRFWRPDFFYGFDQAEYYSEKMFTKKMKLIEIEYDLRTWAATPGHCGHISKLDLNNCDLIEFTSA